MPSVPVQFPTKPTGNMPLFDEPYWESRCGRYRISKMDCVRPWRLFRRIRKGFKNGWQWIGVESGFDTRTKAIVASWHHAKAKRARTKTGEE